MPTPAFISALKSDRCIHYLNNTLVNRAQAIDVSANVPSEVIDELGSSNHAGVVSAPADVSFTVSVFDTGIDLCRNLTGKTSATSLTLSDLINAQVDYVGVVRDNANNFFRSVYVKDACITGIGYKYDISGNAVEAYSFAGDNLTVFDGFVLTKKYTIVAADVTNGYFILPTQGSEAPIATKPNSYFGGNSILRATKLEGGITKSLVEGSDYTYTSTPTKRIVSSGLAVGQEWTLVFYSTTIGTDLSPTFNASLPPAVRGEFTPVSIGISGKTLIPRLQSATIGIDLKRTRVPQLGSTKVLFSSSGVPAVSGNFNVLMNDLALRKLLTYENGNTETQFGIEQMAALGTQNNLGLEAVIKSPVTNEVLKRITVPGIVPITGNVTTNVNSNLTEAYSWTGKTGEVIISNS